MTENEKLTQDLNITVDKLKENTEKILEALISIKNITLDNTMFIRTLGVDWEYDEGMTGFKLSEDNYTNLINIRDQQSDIIEYVDAIRLLTSFQDKDILNIIHVNNI